MIAEDLPGEIWRPIRFKPTDEEEAYWVSNLGRMKSYKKQGPSRERRKDAVLLRGVKTNGYWVHNFKDAEGKKHRKGTHQWVLWAFEGPQPPDKPYVLHKDGDRNNNTLSNLEYGSATENSQDAIRHMSRSYLTEGDLFAIIAQRSLGWEIADIAGAFGLTRHTVQNILSGNSYSLLTGIQYKRQGEWSGEKHYQAKLTEETAAKALHDVLVEDKPQKEVARALGVAYETIHDLIFGKNWKHLPRPTSTPTTDHQD